MTMHNKNTLLGSVPPECGEAIGIDHASEEILKNVLRRLLPLIVEELRQANVDESALIASRPPKNERGRYDKIPK